MEIILPKTDFCAKELFANEIIRKYFISDVTGIPVKDIRSIRLCNPYLWKRYRKQKQGILEKKGKGDAGSRRPEYKSDAEWCYERLKNRMEHFGLSLEEEKSRLIEFGRFAEENCRKRRTKPETFTFLGFTHHCSKSRNGRFRVKRKTSKKKFAKKCREIHRMIRYDSDCGRCRLSEEAV